MMKCLRWVQCLAIPTLRFLLAWLTVIAFSTVPITLSETKTVTPGDLRAQESNSPSVFMIVPEGEAMKFWSRWRGPSGQGIVEGKGYPDTWSGTDNVIWKVEVPGRGHSSPIVWGDRIFLTTASQDGSNRSILCYRRSDGELLWQTPISKGTAERLHMKNSYASATVSTDGKRVYAYFGNGGLLAVDFDGKVLWQVSFGEIDLYHGPGGTPLLYKDRLILLQEQMSFSRSDPGKSGFLVAIDKETGRELWRVNRSPRPGWGTPIAVQVGDRVEVIVSSSRRIDAIDPQTGDILWFCSGNMAEVIPTPVVGHGLIYCCSGRRGPTIAVRPGGTGDVTSTHVAWQIPKESPFVPSPLLLGDNLYTVNDMLSEVSCFDAKTGELIGQLSLGRPTRESFSASPIAVGGKVFVTNDEGETFVLNPAPDFRLLHINRFGERTLASPALVDGRWYYRTEDHLICIGE